MARAYIEYIRRGKVVRLAGISSDLTLLDHLRLEQKATGTKEGCNEGDCGACSVVLARVIDGQLVHQVVNACILLVGQVDGAEIITVEDLAEAETLHPIQQALVTHHGSQCGFCTPGIVMSLFALYQAGARPVTRAMINDQLAGNLCRCTGYRPIADAALSVCGGEREDRFSRRETERLEALTTLDHGQDLFVGSDATFFAAPASLASLHQLRAQYPDAVLVGGATDVGLWVTKRLQDLPRIIWLGRVKALQGIVHHQDGLQIGAGVTVAEAAGALGMIDPDLGELLRRFGSAQVRTSATVGGNIGNASPIGDLAPALIALRSEVDLQSADGMRRVPLEDFFIAYGKQDRAPCEIITGVNVPRLGSGQLFRCYKVSKRFDEDISAVMGAFCFTVVEGKITSVRIAFGGMAGTPKRAVQTEKALSGVSLSAPATWEAAMMALGMDYQPLSDMRASAAYRLAVARGLLSKALLEAGGLPSAATRLVGVRPEDMP